MNKHITIAAAVAASLLALQAPIAGAADNDTKASQSGVPGVEVNVGDNASDRGLPGVEMNVGRDGDQKNVDTGTLGAGPDTSTNGSSQTNDEASLDRPMRADRG